MIQVVATRKGLYGGKIRLPHEAFEIADKAEMSARWMVEVGTREHTAFVGTQAGVKAAEQRVAEERRAAGGIEESLAVTLEENRDLRMRISELEAENRVLRERAAAPGVKPPTPARADYVEEGATTPGDQPEPRRRTRRLPNDTE